MLPFSGAPFNVHYALRVFFCLIIIICSFLSQAKHVLGQQPLKGLAIIISKCGSNSVIAAFHNSHHCSSVNKQGAVRHMMGARSNLATRVYHQDTKHPGAGKLSPLPAHGSLTAGQIDGALVFSLTKNSFLQSLGASPGWGCKLHEGALGANYMKELCWCCSKETWSLPACREGSAGDQKYCTESYVGQALVRWLCFERHLQGFPDGPF